MDVGERLLAKREVSRFLSVLPVGCSCYCARSCRVTCNLYLSSENRRHMIRLESLTLRAVVVCPDDKSARCTREGETEQKTKEINKK